MTATWSENDSASFIRFAEEFVPERAGQLAVVSAMAAPPEGGLVLDLCCGPGALCRRLLTDHTGSRVIGVDASALMLEKSRAALAEFGDRFTAEHFDLGSAAWRDRDAAPDAVVSSLAVHHLDGPRKQRLYQDVHRMLRPGGRFVLADLIAPAGARAHELARRMWDDAVRANANAAGLGDEPYEAFHELEWSCFQYPDDLDKPSPLADQLRWLEEIGFTEVDVYWLKAGHAIYGGRREEETS